jgi:cell division protein FtsN
VDSGARDSDGIDKFFPGATDEAALRLLTVLQSRPGHVLVIGAHAADVDAVFERVDAQLTCHRRLRIAGAGLDPEGVIRALGVDLASADPPPSATSILTTLVTEARAAGAPVVVVVAQAEEADDAALERLCALIDEVSDARDTVRLVLLGGPRLTRMLAQPGARKLWARFMTTVQAPPCERAVLDTPAAPLVERRARRWGTGVAVATALSAVALLVGSVRNRGVPPAVQTEERAAPAVVAVEPPPQVAPAPSDPAPPEPAAEPASPPVVIVSKPEVVRPLEVATEAERAQKPTVTTRPERVPQPAVVEPEVARQTAVAPHPDVARASDVALAARSAPEGAARTAVSTPARGEILQLGAFRSAENAQALREQVARLFPDAQVSNVMLAGVEYHRVRLGAASERDLTTRAATLKAAGFSTVRVRD